MRVGRSAIDEEAVRLLEEANPDVQFDWGRILKQAPDGSAVEAESVAPPRARSDRPRERRAPAEPRRETPAAAAPPPPVPAIPAAPETDKLPEGAAFQRLGAEALARLRARYAEIMARIAERQGDEAEREELKGRAERLNPDTWVTDADVDEGLEQYEAVYESIRAVVGHARRRRDRS